MNFPYTYLRVSVTDRCNFRCFYCRPELKSRFLNPSELLSNDEIVKLAERFVQNGIKHLRLTGGEPLLRKGLAGLAKDLSQLPGLEVLSLTSNGFNLSKQLILLKKSGINRINVSLDTLRRDRFKKICGLDCFVSVKNAIIAASDSGFEQIRINVVVIRGINDDEVLDFVDFGAKNSLDVRFIEFFPTHSRCEASGDFFVSSKEIKQKIESSFGQLICLGNDPYSGPAQYFRVGLSGGRIGFISSVSDFFCSKCNRLRLSCDGKLYPCLHSDYCVDIKAPLRENDGQSLLFLIEEAASDKKFFNKAFCQRQFDMSKIGG